MTMPHLMNCSHSDTGWCLECVRKLWHDLHNSKVRLLALKYAIEELVAVSDGDSKKALIDKTRNEYFEEEDG